MLKNKKLLIASLFGAAFMISSCAQADLYAENVDPFEGEDIIESTIEEEVIELIPEEEIEVEEPVDENTIEFNTTEIETVIDSNRTPIYDSIADRNVIGYFVPNREFDFTAETANWNVINYYGNTGYVLKDDTYTSTRRVMNIDMIDKGFVKEETPIYDNYDLDCAYANLSSLEFVEIYKELDNCYLVQTIDYLGFIPKDSVELLPGTVAVVDRSNQELRLYEGNNMTICTPVVTGTKDTDRESDLGLFEVRLQAENLYIVPGSWVDCVTYYNGGEGIHTAEWRTIPEFGGDTYLNNGSHGCINTPHDEAIYVHNALTLGDKVLVKE